VVGCAHLRMRIKAMTARVRWKNPRFWETYHAIRSCSIVSFKINDHVYFICVCSVGKGLSRQTCIAA